MKNKNKTLTKEDIKSLRNELQNCRIILFELKKETKAQIHELELIINSSRF